MICNVRDAREDYVICEKCGTVDVSIVVDNDDFHPDIPMTGVQFQELFGNSDFYSNFEWFG